jgi:signal transduction histidine kinase
MIKLVPQWAHQYTEFWDSIRRRNLWFIQLRYGAFVMLSGFILFSYFLLDVKYSDTQLIACFTVSISIFTYNFILQSIRKYLKCEPGTFNPLHFSLLQIGLDIIALFLLLHYTGGIESPLYMLFVFHMIIGGLILPGSVVYSIAAFVFIVFGAMTISEYFGVIPHHHISGLIEYELSTSKYYIGLILTTFGFTIFISAYVANRIAQRLYDRERALLESIDKINSAEKEKQKYIMNIVHELKTPLAAVSSYLELVLQKFLGPINKNVETKLIRAKYRTDEGLDMINDVLNVSKLKLYDRFDVEEINLEELVCSIINRRKITAETQLISLQLEDKRTDKKNVKGDKFLLHIAISNLVGNAIKYGIENGKVMVTLMNDESNQIIKICDDGIGIPSKDQAKVFDDFYRSSNAKKISADGSGLGLPAVKQIIERHNGKVQVESPSPMGNKNNPGSCFTVVLPCKLNSDNSLFSTD